MEQTFTVLLACACQAQKRQERLIIHSACPPGVVYYSVMEKQEWRIDEWIEIDMEEGLRKSLGRREEEREQRERREER